MSLYADLTDEDLDAKIDTLRAAIEQVAMGGVARVVAGEGRRIEYSAANKDGLNSLFTIAVREKQARAGVQVSGAITVTFPYGGNFGC